MYSYLQLCHTRRGARDCMSYTDSALSFLSLCQVGLFWYFFIFGGRSEGMKICRIMFASLRTGAGYCAKQKSNIPPASQTYGHTEYCISNKNKTLKDTGTGVFNQGFVGLQRVIVADDFHHEIKHLYVIIMKLLHIIQK